MKVSFLASKGQTGLLQLAVMVAAFAYDESKASIRAGVEDILLSPASDTIIALERGDFFPGLTRFVKFDRKVIMDNSLARASIFATNFNTIELRVEVDGSTLTITSGSRQNREWVDVVLEGDRASILKHWVPLGFTAEWASGVAVDNATRVQTKSRVERDQLEWDKPTVLDDVMALLNGLPIEHVSEILGRAMVRSSTSRM